MITILSLIVACGGSEPAKPTAPEKPAAPAPAAPAAPAPAEAAPAAPADAAAPTDAAAAPAAGGGDAAAGKAVYDTNCVACHQADGTGMNGMLAANFVADKTRLAKTDEELLKSIREGKTGGTAVMPPWGAILSEQQQKDVLAYVRATFGGK